MPALPVVSGYKAVRAFERLGWEVHRHESTHWSMKKEGHPALLTVIDEKEMATGTLRRLIRDSGLTVDQFVAALKK